MAQITNVPTMGADYSWIAPVTEGVGNVIGGLFGKKGSGYQSSPPPPPKEIPWIPIVAIAAGALVLTGVIVVKVRK